MNQFKYFITPLLAELTANRITVERLFFRHNTQKNNYTLSISIEGVNKCMHNRSYDFLIKYDNEQFALMLFGQNTRPAYKIRLRSVDHDFPEKTRQLYALANIGEDAIKSFFKLLATESLNDNLSEWCIVKDYKKYING